MNKVLIVSSEIIKDKYSASLTTYKFIQEASKLYEVDVLTEPMAIINFEHQCKNIFYTNYIGYKGVFYLKVLNRIYKIIFKHNVFRKFRYFAFVKALKNINLEAYDFVIAFGGGDFFEPLEALANVHEKGDFCKMGYVHDPFPVDLYPSPYKEEATKKTLSQKNKLSKIFSKMDKIVFPSQLLGEWMNSFYNFGYNKIVIVPHGIPNKIEFEKPTIVSTFLDKYKLDKNEYFLHSGTLLYHRRIEPIIEAFKIYKKAQGKDSNTKLLFIGNSQYEIKNDFKDVIIINDRMPLKLINSLSIISKGLLIIEHNGAISPFLPGKFPEYLYFNKPILHFGPYNSEINRIVRSFSEKSYNTDNFSAPLDEVDAIVAVFLKGGVNFFHNRTLIDYFRFKYFR